MKNIDLKIRYHTGQKKIFFEDTDVRWKFVSKGRRFGWTQGASNFVIEKLLDNLSPVLWIDVSDENCIKVFERFFLSTLTHIPKSLWIWRQEKGELNINGNLLDFRSSIIPSHAEGFPYRLIVLNEAGIILKK